MYCMAEVARAGVAVAYLMYSERRGVEDAIKSLNRRYPRGHPGVRLKPADTESLRNSDATVRAAAGEGREARAARDSSIRFDSIRFDSIRFAHRDDAHRRPRANDSFVPRT